MNGKKYVLLFFYTFLSVIVQGQISEQTDSLKNPHSYLQVQSTIQAAQRSVAQQNVDSAFFYYNSALDQTQQDELVFLEAHILYNIGKVFFMLQQKDTAVVIFSQAANIWREHENYLELNKTLTNISSILQEKGASLKGLQISQEAIESAQLAEYERGEGIAYLLRGNFLFSVARYDEALVHFHKASDIFQSINFKAGVGMCYNSIANVYNILEQKDIIEEQQQNIIDSIHYASRIQEAILPQKDTISEIFNDNLFVLFKPRDIVSGDFYWIGKKFDKHIFMAADCTGHGVPGAFMSMLGTAFLNDIIVGESDSISSHEILNTLREYVITSLRQTGKEGEQKDGMDVALCMYDEKTKVVDFAGANNPLVVVRKGEINDNLDIDTSRVKLQTFVSAANSKTYSIIQVQGDKMPIGIYDNQKPFASVSLQLQEGDTVYVFSDGYQDQFGGEKNKKFMIKRLKQLFVDINGFDVQSQHNLLDKTLVNWMKQSDAEQVDDILVIGFKVS